MHTLKDYIKNLKDTPPSLDSLLSDSYAVGKELEVWRNWYDDLQKKKRHLQYRLGMISSEKPELTPYLQSISDLLDEACSYPIPEKDADFYLK